MEMVVTYSEIVLRYMPVGTDKNYENVHIQHEIHIKHAWRK